jgi:hypothetical protein
VRYGGHHRRRFDTCRDARGGRLDMQYPRHLAEQIADGLDLKAEDADQLKNQIRYATAWFDCELTQARGR